MKQPTVASPIGVLRPIAATGEREKRESRTATAVFVGGLAVLSAYVLWLGRDLWFFFDEWNRIAVRYHGHLLTPHNDHLTLLPTLVWQAFERIFGVGSYTPYRLVGLIFYLACVAALYWYLRRRVTPGLACFLALIFAWFSRAEEVVLWPEEMISTIPLAATIGVWAMLDMDRPSRDWAASAFLAIALATSAVGLASVAAVAVELLVRRAPWKRLGRLALPVGLWFIWFAVYREPVGETGSLSTIASFAVREIDYTFLAFAGGWRPGGWLLEAATAAIVLLAISRWHTFTPRAAGALAAAAAFAVLTAYGRSEQGLISEAASRYLWVVAFFIVVAMADCLRGVRLPRLTTTIVAMLAVVNAVVLIGHLRDTHDQRLAYQAGIRPYLAATEAIPRDIDRTRVLPLSFKPITTGEYLDAIAHVGSVYPERSRSLGRENSRLTADQWMISDLELRFAPVASAPTQCQPIGDGPVVRTAVPARTMLLITTSDGPVSVRMRRFAATFANPPVATLPPYTQHVLTIAGDRSSRPWQLQLTHPAEMSRCASA